MVDNGFDDPLYALLHLDLHHNQLSGTLSNDLLNGLSALTYVFWSVFEDSRIQSKLRSRRPP